MQWVCDNHKKCENTFHFWSYTRRTEIKALDAIAQWRIHHCWSPVLFLSGGLYKVLQWGVASPSLSVQEHSGAAFFLFLFKNLTQTLERFFLFAVLRGRCWLQQRTFSLKGKADLHCRERFCCVRVCPWIQHEEASPHRRQCVPPQLGQPLSHPKAQHTSNSLVTEFRFCSMDQAFQIYSFCLQQSSYQLGHGSAGDIKFGSINQRLF